MMATTTELSVIGRKLSMSDGEILQMYKEAKDKKKQVDILADLTLCSKSEIVTILKSQGVDGRQLPRPRAPKSDAVAATTAINNNTKPAEGVKRRRTKKVNIADAATTSEPQLSQESVVEYINSLKQLRKETQATLDGIDEKLRNIAKMCGIDDATDSVVE